MGKDQIQGWAMIFIAILLVASPYLLNRPEMAHHKILVATEKIDKGIFKNSVVLVVYHGTVKARGYILNGEGAGGPVNPEHLTALHSPDAKAPGSIALPDLGLMLTDGKGAEQLRQAEMPPKEALFVKGYAGWGLGQLDREIAHGDWKVIGFDSALVFSGQPDIMWAEAMRRASVGKGKAPAPAPEPVTVP